jgi:acetyl esterase/lipase
MDILSRTPPTADQRIHYGPGEFQFGDLWLPKVRGGKASPVVVFFHGGWWQAAYDLAYAGFLCESLRNDGITVWSVEYRRVGDAGGGWPGTFQDAAAWFDFVKELAGKFPLDLGRVVVAGHSAGGHLAFWTAGRHHVPEGSVLSLPRPTVGVHAAISLAGAVDLRLTCDLASGVFAHDKEEVAALMGGLAKDVPERYAAGDPGLLLPLGVAQVLIQGTRDGQIPPELPGRWAGNARRQHDAVEVVVIEGADHFDVVDPESAAWPQVRGVFRKACFG